MSAGTKFRRIVFVTSGLGGGGAERVLITMADHWANEGHQVSVVTLRRDAQKEYSVSSAVKIVRLSLIDERNPFWSFQQVHRLWKLRRGLLELRPDVVLSFIDKLNAAVVLALWGTGIPVVATEHLTPWQNPLGACWELVRRAAYAHAQAVVSPNSAMTRWFVQRMIGNFVTLPYPSKNYTARAEAIRESRVLGVGRLSFEKGFDLLIAAFARIASRFPQWSLEIAGEGPKRPQLEGLIRDFKLEDRVRLLGHVGDIETVYARAGIFALSSRHEAYPMVLIEAMRAGCCVVAVDCPSGVRAILGGESSGLIAVSENVASLASALAHAMADSSLRLALAENGKRRAEKLGAEHVVLGWNQLLVNLLDASCESL